MQTAHVRLLAAACAAVAVFFRVQRTNTLKTNGTDIVAVQNLPSPLSRSMTCHTSSHHNSSSAPDPLCCCLRRR